MEDAEQRSRDAVGRADHLQAAFDDLARRHHVAVTDLDRVLNDEGGAFATWVPPGHFYSALPSLPEVERAAGRIFRERAEDGIPGVDVRPDAQLDLLSRLAALVDPLGIPRTKTQGWRFHGVNESYEMADASVLAGMLLHIRPTRVIEVGSGYSSALMLDLRERALPDVELTFIEPYPELLDALIDDVDRASTRRLALPAQEVPIEEFTRLGAGDVLLIDSSHVAKIGSDVNHLFLEVLPRLATGVWVHVHDVFWPFEYPQHWVREGRSWNEQYLLRALLQESDRWQVELFTHLLLTRHRAAFEAAFPGAEPYFGGSFWMRRC